MSKVQRVEPDVWSDVFATFIGCWAHSSLNFVHNFTTPNYIRSTTEKSCGSSNRQVKHCASHCVYFIDSKNRGTETRNKKIAKPAFRTRAISASSGRNKATLSADLRVGSCTRQRKPRRYTIFHPAPAVFTGCRLPLMRFRHSRYPATLQNKRIAPSCQCKPRACLTSQ